MAQPVDPNRGERIAKLLARAGVASRREIERMIADGRIARDGMAIETPATVLPSLDGVTVDGNPVAAAEPARLFLYHKPPGLLVTERDPRGRPTIYDQLAQGFSGDLPRLVPVGRLDLNTEGLLLLTTDGGLKRQLELPATGVERTYRARAYGPVSQPLLEQLIEGIEIDGFRYGPIDANLERRTGANSWIELTLAEGKNREVRRVLEYLGLEVSRLIRTRYGPFVLGDMPAGAIGEVRQADLIAFRHTLGKATPLTRRPAGTPPRATIAVTSASPGAAARRPRPAGKPRPEGRTPNAPPARPPAERRPAAPASQRPTGKGRAPDASSPPPSSPGPRRGGQTEPPARGQRKVEPPAASPDAATPARPARIQRKPGWARPKPKTGPGKPRKR